MAALDYCAKSIYAPFIAFFMQVDTTSRTG